VATNTDVKSYYFRLSNRKAWVTGGILSMVIRGYAMRRGCERFAALRARLGHFPLTGSGGTGGTGGNRGSNP
jgi:hypothetical protein